jgi:hypothetical protein
MRSQPWKQFIPGRRTRAWLVSLCLLALVALQFGAAAPIARAEATANQRGA